MDFSAAARCAADTYLDVRDLRLRDAHKIAVQTSNNSLQGQSILEWPANGNPIGYAYLMANDQDIVLSFQFHDDGFQPYDDIPVRLSSYEARNKLYVLLSENETYLYTYN